MHAHTLFALTQLDAKMEIDVDEYVDSFKPTLMDVVHRWARALSPKHSACIPDAFADVACFPAAQSNGCEFAELLKVCDLFEGTLIRAVRRLDELLGQLAAAAAAVGDTGLKASFEAAALSLRHGIMFANSLYL